MKTVLESESLRFGLGGVFINPVIVKASIKTPLYLSVSEDRKCASTACPLIFLRFPHDTDSADMQSQIILNLLALQ